MSILGFAPLAKGRACAIFATIGLVAVLSAVGASPATATPTGEYSVFSDCPVGIPSTTECLVWRFEGGEIKLGRLQIPITNTQILQGGLTEAEKGGVRHVIAAADSNTLPSAPQQVLGGLPGFVGSLRVPCPLRSACPVTATIEQATPTTSITLNEGNLARENGTGLSLPIKIKFDTSTFGAEILGSECYVGSNENPIMLNLTTGTTSPPEPNGPINGKYGRVSVGFEGVASIIEDTIVDNSFSAPGASGCGPLGAANLLINATNGLPSEEGHNTAILNGTLEEASAEAVKAHE